MKVKEVLQLRDAWGDKPCEHPDYDREIVVGCASGDYICVQCGRELTKQEIEAINNRKIQR